MVHNCNVHVYIARYVWYMIEDVHCFVLYCIKLYTAQQDHITKLIYHNQAYFGIALDPPILHVTFP